MEKLPLFRVDARGRINLNKIFSPGDVVIVGLDENGRVIIRRVEHDIENILQVGVVGKDGRITLNRSVRDYLDSHLLTIMKIDEDKYWLAEAVVEPK